MKVAVTGPNGWIAKALQQKLQSHYISSVGVNRAWLAPQTNQDKAFLTNALSGCNSVVHLAALVHQMNATPTLTEYRAINCELTLNLAQRAAEVGVGQFIFISTAKVMGERSSRPFLEGDSPAPIDAYSIAKLEAETGLQSLQRDGKLGSMKVVIVRPPLVFGNGVGANYEKLIALANTGWPLPLGSATAPRSMVSIDRLTDGLIALLKAKEQLKNLEVFFASEPNDQSTASIIREVRTAAGRSAALINVPPKLMQTALSALGKEGIFERLFTSLQVDGSRLNNLIKNTSEVPTNSKG
jgi:nucleoside-diphosphate-sugar epimerase